MKIQKHTMYNYLFILILWATSAAQAKEYRPSAPDEIIAEWQETASPVLRQLQTSQQKQPQNPQAVAQLVNAYLQQAALPGQSRLYGLAQAALAPLIENNTESAAIWLAWAQVQQHQHAFKNAEQALQKVLQLDPGNNTAILLQARLALIQGNPAAAKRICVRLFGRSDLLTLSACSLEASSYGNTEALDESYTELQRLAAQGLPADERKIWLQQLLADMAMRSAQPLIAAHYLEENLNAASVSQWAQWADAQLALHQPENILDKLTPILNNSTDMDDALLVRMALAEKQSNAQTHTWKNLLQERVVLREQRGDSQHAADLAIYYLDIQPNPQKALNWATENWRQAQEPADQKLLARAQLISTQAQGE